MVHTISVIGTEAYYEAMSNPDDHMRKTAFDKFPDWWECEIEDGSGNYEPSFTRFTTAIPEDELSTSSMSDRRADASRWLADNISVFDDRDSFQILDWVEKSGDGWPLGLAGVGTAMTGSTYKTGITNVYRFENPSYFFSEVEEFGTSFHELLHNYNVRHRHGGVNTDDEASFILSATLDEDDDSCYWSGNSNQRTEWTTSCTRSRARDHVDDNR